MSAAPPAIPGVRRYRVTARGVDFHVTESGDPDGRPVLALHGWPHHHWTYRDVLRDPPAGLRIIAPDLPGYGWSGPAPHDWEKAEVALDVLALMDALGLGSVLLAGHDWGCFVGYLLTLDHPERFDGFVAVSIQHPWNSGRSTLLNSWRFSHIPPNALLGKWLMQRTSYLDKVLFPLGAQGDKAATRDDFRVYSARFRDPVCAAATRDTYRTFLVKELPALVRNGPEERSVDVPVRALIGDKDIVPPSWLSPETAKAADYTLQVLPGVGHFLIDERPDVFRQALVDLAAATGGLR